MRRMREEEGRTNVSSREGKCEKDEGKRGRTMSAVERVHVRRIEGTNLHVSTQSSSFLFVHSIRAEPPNTPCKMPIKQMESFYKSTSQATCSPIFSLTLS